MSADLLMNLSKSLPLSGKAVDSANVLPGTNAALELSKLFSGSAAECGDGSTTERRLQARHLVGFGQSNPIVDSTLDRTHPDLTGEPSSLC